MSIQRLIRPVLVMGFSGLVVTSVLLSACGGSTETSAEPTAPLAATEAPVTEAQPTDKNTPTHKAVNKNKKCNFFMVWFSPI